MPPFTGGIFHGSAMRREQDARDHARCDRGEHEGAVDLNPLITRRRRLQIMRARVIDDILRTAVVGRQAVAAMPVAMRHGAMRVGALWTLRALRPLRTAGAIRAATLVGDGMTARAAIIARGVLRERLALRD